MSSKPEKLLTVFDQVAVCWQYNPKLQNMFPPGLEPGTFRVLGERDNHYTTETLSTVAS